MAPIFPYYDLKTHLGPQRYDNGGKAIKREVIVDSVDIAGKSSSTMKTDLMLYSPECKDPKGAKNGNCNAIVNVVRYEQCLESGLNGAVPPGPDEAVDPSLPKPPQDGNIGQGKKFLPLIEATRSQALCIRTLNEQVFQQKVAMICTGVPKPDGYSSWVMADGLFCSNGTLQDYVDVGPLWDASGNDRFPSNPYGLTSLTGASVDYSGAHVDYRFQPVVQGRAPSLPVFSFHHKTISPGFYNVFGQLAQPARAVDGISIENQHSSAIGADVSLKVDDCDDPNGEADGKCSVRLDTNAYFSCLKSERARLINRM